MTFLYPNTLKRNMNTNSQQQITIPPGYFIKAVKAEYSDYQEALWRELFQNSLDAGSTRIDVFVNDSGFTFRDNGCGMDRETLINGMLTLGGTVKGENATGGFGQAKNLLTLCHKSYIVKTRNLVVDGSGIYFHISEADDYLQGTEYEVIPDSDFEWSRYTSLQNLKSILVKSDIRNNKGEKVEIFVNKEDWSHYRTPVGTHAAGADIDWCKIY